MRTTTTTAAATTTTTSASTTIFQIFIAVAFVGYLSNDAPKGARKKKPEKQSPRRARAAYRASVAPRPLLGVFKKNAAREAVGPHLLHIWRAHSELTLRAFEDIRGAL